MKRLARVQSQLSESLHKRLNAYALAASAAGVATLALAPPAEGKIIYRHVNLHISHSHRIVSLDLLQQQETKAEFTIFWSGAKVGSRGTFTSGIVAKGLSQRSITGSQNEIWIVSGCPGYAAALLPGVKIGGSTSAELCPQGPLVFRGYYHTGGGTFTNGRWANVSNRYVGLKFVVAGQAHYGWARLNVYAKGPLHGTLTGYAYETIPGKPIITGKTHGKDEATLGRLAQGASGGTASRQKQ